MDVERASDNELIEASRKKPADAAEACLDALYRRYYHKVAYWCLRVCGDREEAAELAQEVFVRVHSRLDSFRMESSFSTWLYTVTRRVAINRGLSVQRRRNGLATMRDGFDPPDEAHGPGRTAEHNEMLGQVRSAMETDLDPLEAKVLYLHYVDGLTLPAITKLLKLENKSGAKAHVVNGLRKLKRRFRVASGRDLRSLKYT